MTTDEYETGAELYERIAAAQLVRIAALEADNARLLEALRDLLREQPGKLNVKKDYHLMVTIEAARAALEQKP